MKTRNALLSFGLIAMVLMFAPLAHATILNPGDVVFCPCPVALPSHTFVDSTGQQTKLTVGSSPFSVTFEENVYREAGGTLDFYYQFSVSGKSANAIDLSVGDFTGFATNVGFVNFPLSGFGPGTRQPSQLDRSTDGSTIDFFFFPGVSNNQTTFTLLIETDATSYDTTTAEVQDHSNAVFNAFEPMTTPEPASIVLFGTVLALTGLVVRRKFARKQG